MKLSTIGIRAALAMMLGVTVACSGGDGIGAPTTNLDTLFWSLRLNHTAVTMAVGETLQLTATPLTVNEEPIDGLPTASFVSSDTSALQVDATGKVTAVGTGFGIYIVATLSSVADQSTNVDTAFFNVTSTAHPIRTFSIQPTDSAIAAIGWGKDVTVHVENEDGMYNPDLLVYYSTSDITRAGVDRFWAYLDARKPGPVMVYAQTTAYGVTYIDSTEITIVYPIEAMVMIYPSTDVPTSDPYFIAPIITIQRGGTVYWINGSQREIDVTFTDSTHVDGGNIPAVPVDGAEGRMFPTPGTYEYRSVQYGTSGRIVVNP